LAQVFTNAIVFQDFCIEKKFSAILSIILKQEILYKNLSVMKKIIVFLSVICASGLVMVTIYNLIVDAKSWGSDIPASIITVRDYYKHVDPRNFFAIVAPINMVLIVLSIILFWKDSVSIRTYFCISFLLYAIIAALTFVYFIPRDRIIFTMPIEGHTEQIMTALSQWKNMNWLRTLLGLTGVLFTIKGIDSFYKIHS
jgi:anthrone oxygenase-like protein